MIIQEPILFYIRLFLITGLVMAGAFFLAMFKLSWALQDEAQFLAASQGKYGGYTVEANNSLREFVAEQKLNPANLTVRVSAPNQPVPWGTVVKADITYNFRFKVGEFIDIPTPIPLTGRGRSTSTYLEGAYTGVNYTSPAF